MPPAPANQGSAVAQMGLVLSARSSAKVKNERSGKLLNVVVTSEKKVSPLTNM